MTLPGSPLVATSGSRYPVERCALLSRLGRKFVEHLICGVCHDILDDPLVTPCDHTFCYSCCRGLKAAEIRTCPLCNRPTFGFTGKRNREGNPNEGWLFSLPTKSFLHLLSGTPMICDNAGCSAIVTLEEFSDHKLNQCQHRIVSCTVKGCNQQLRAHDVAEHEACCPMRAVSCHCCEEIVNGRFLPGYRVTLCNPLCISNMKQKTAKLVSQLQDESRMEKKCLTDCISALVAQLQERENWLHAFRYELSEQRKVELNIATVGEKTAEPANAQQANVSMSPAQGEVLKRSSLFGHGWTKSDARTVNAFNGSSDPPLNVEAGLPSSSDSSPLQNQEIHGVVPSPSRFRQSTINRVDIQENYLQIQNDPESSSSRDTAVRSTCIGYATSEQSDKKCQRADSTM